jgi:glycosyltransferase involved in cell wall biosynthesis
MQGALEKEDPVVSVVIPVYNGELYLTAAIESILSQTFTAHELLIVDDGSTDQTQAIAQRYAASGSRVRLISHRKPRGNYPSRNEGMELARGEFIAVMDADDIAMPNRLEHQVQFLRSHPEHKMVGSQVLLIDPDGDPLGPMEGLPTEHDEIDALLLNRQWAVVHPSVMMRKDAVETIRGYRERFDTCADQDLYLRLAEIGRIANLPRVLLKYRRHYGSMTINQTDQRYNLRVIQQEARKRRGLSALDDIEMPPIQEKKPLTQNQKMQVHLRWAVTAGSNAYMRSALKHLKKAVLLDPTGLVTTIFNRTLTQLRLLS